MNHPVRMSPDTARLRGKVRATVLAGLVLLAGSFLVWRTVERRSATSPAAQQTRHVDGTLVSDGSPDPAPQRPLFTDVTDQVGLAFLHRNGAGGDFYLPEEMGSGAAFLDYDDDGDMDIYLIQSGSLTDPTPDDHARLFRNDAGMSFVDVTDESGTAVDGYGMGATCADYDQDGDVDILVTRLGTNVLLQNNGDGTFSDVTEIAGIKFVGFGTGAAFLDFDSDGLLDLYVCNYGRWSLETNQFCGDRERNVRIHCSPHTVPPERDVFYQNLGNGTFRDVTEPTGLANRAGRAQGVIAADFNEDGLIDLYIGNDLHANSLFLNEGNGHFQDAMEISGVAYDYLGHLQAGMGVDAADVNADGRLDLFVTNFENEHNAFYENLGNGFFQELSHARGLAADSMPWVGWGTVFADFDLDGWADVFVTNGHTDDNLHKLGRDSQHAQPPLIWHNVNGRFIGVRESAGTYFAQDHVGRGLALGCDHWGSWWHQELRGCGARRQRGYDHRKDLHVVEPQREHRDDQQRHRSVDRRYEWAGDRLG